MARSARVRRLGPVMRIAVDVMGGDHGCGVVIEGAKRALQTEPRITALYWSATEARSTPPCLNAGFATIACASSTPARS
jgi:fatty acid/phospholipid biosynthesis enzyme